jgi:hypothetical protein
MSFTRSTVEVGSNTSDMFAFVHTSTIFITTGPELDGYAVDDPAATRTTRRKS